MISPIGTFLAKFDAAMTISMDVGIQGLSSYMQLPMAAAISLYFGIMGYKVAHGDNVPINYLAAQVARASVALYLSTNAVAYNNWVRDFFYDGVPGALSTAVMSKVGGAGIGPGVGGGLNGTAAAMDQVWNQSWVVMAKVYATAGTLDVGTKLAAYWSGLTAGIGLMVMALVYLAARFLMAIVLEIGVIVIFLTLFEVTRSLFERWLGKIFALICLQLAGVITLQIIITGDQEFMTAIATSGASGGAADIQALTSMVVWFTMGAFAMYALPAVAYSIGTGVSVSTMPALLATAAAVRGGAKLAAAGLNAIPDYPSAPPAISMAGAGGGGGASRLASSGGSGTAAIAPPPPLALAGP